jgi:hypothetical protein
MQDSDGYGPKRIEEDRRWKPQSVGRFRAPISTDADAKIKRARGLLNKVRSRV